MQKCYLHGVFRHLLEAYWFAEHVLPLATEITSEMMAAMSWKGKVFGSEQGNLVGSAPRAIEKQPLGSGCNVAGGGLKIAGIGNTSHHRSQIGFRIDAIQLRRAQLSPPTSEPAKG